MLVSPEASLAAAAFPRGHLLLEKLIRSGGEGKEKKI